MRAVLLAVLLAGPALAGCVGTDDARTGTPRPVPESDPADGAGAPPPTYRTACPPGDTQQNAQGVCVASLRRADRSLQEPFVAVDPSDPDRIAVGVNAGEVQGAADARGPAQGVYVTRVDLFVSRDGGESWRLVQHPPLPVDGTTFSSVDPTLVWGDGGRLHVAGQVVHDVREDGNPTSADITPFYARLEPDGTWSRVRGFQMDGDQDRPWLSRGPSGELFLTWSSFGSSSQGGLAWSHDGGDTWNTIHPPEACGTAGPVRVFDGSPIWPCGGGTLYALDRADGALEAIASPDLGQGIFPILLQPTDGTLVLLAQDRATVKASVAEGSPANWSDPIDLRDRLDVEDGWDRAALYGWSTGQHGTVHLLLSGPGPRRQMAPDPVVGDRRVAFAVLAPDLPHVLRQTLLQSSDPQPDDRRLPPSAGPPVGGDHYYGLDVTSETGWAAWTSDRGIDLTRIAPASGPAPSG